MKSKKGLTSFTFPKSFKDYNTLGKSDHVAYSYHRFPLFQRKGYNCCEHRIMARLWLINDVDKDCGGNSTVRLD